MAKTKIEVDLVVTGGNSVEQVETKVVSLKQQLKNLKEELASGTLTGEAFDKAAKKAGELQDRIGDVSQRVKNLASDSRKLDGFISLTQGIVGGFAAVQGITALVGEEDEELNKTLVKLQASMTALTGIQAVANTLNKDSAASVTLLAGAWNKLNTVMKVTVIGAIISGVALLVSYWDDIKESITGITNETRELEKATKADYDISLKKTETLGTQDNILRLQGLTEKEILKLKIAQTNETIKKGEKELLVQKSVLEAQIASDKKNKEILQGVLRFIEAPIILLLKSIDDIGKAFGKNFGLQKGFEDKVTNIFFDPEKTRQKGEEELAIVQEKLNELRNASAGYQLQIQKIDKDFADKKAEENKKVAEKEIKEKVDLKLREGLALYETELELWQREKDFKKQQEAEDEKDRQQRIQDYADEQNAKQAIATNSFDILNNIAALAMGEQYKYTRLGKILALSQIATDTALAISSLVKNSEGNIYNPITGGVAGAVQFTTGLARIVANIANAKRILQGGGSPSGSSSGGSNQVTGQAPPLKGFIPQGQTGSDTQRGTKVYVLEKDITDTQGRVARIKSNAELI